MAIEHCRIHQSQTRNPEIVACESSRRSPLLKKKCNQTARLSSSTLLSQRVIRFQLMKVRLAGFVLCIAAGVIWDPAAVAGSLAVTMVRFPSTALASSK